jgi:hypothetical protein
MQCYQVVFLFHWNVSAHSHLGKPSHLFQLPGVLGKQAIYYLHPLQYTLLTAARGFYFKISQITSLPSFHAPKSSCHLE